MLFLQLKIKNMGCRSKIARVNEDGTITSVHCQYNSECTTDKRCVGFNLLKLYNTADSIDKLFVDKSMSYLEPLEFLDRLEVNPVFNTEKDWFDSIAWDIEYMYLFKDGKWFANNVELTKEVLKKGVKSCSWIDFSLFQREGENTVQWQRRLNRQKNLQAIKAETKNQPE